MFVRNLNRRTTTATMACGVLFVISSTSLLAAETDATQEDVEIPAPAYVTLMVARSPVVQTELKLNEKQRGGVRAAIAKVDQVFWQFRDVPPQKCAEQLDAELGKLRAGLTAALSPEQMARFDQIVIQARGARALIAPDVREKLGLNSEQATEIAKLVKAADSGKLDSQKVLALLTPEQQSQLAALFGPSFNVSKITRIGCVAPEFRSVDAWINSEPLSLEALRGKVVVVHFWAFGCINCVRNLPHYQGWYDQFSKSDLTIIGIHTPETGAERDLGNLKQNIIERGIKYPVAFDAAAENWKAWANNMWPSVYLIDRHGQVRSWWYGELNWEGARGEEAMRKQIAALIAEK